MVVLRLSLSSLSYFILVRDLVEMGGDRYVDVDGIESTLQRRYVTDYGRARRMVRLSLDKQYTDGPCRGIENKAPMNSFTPINKPLLRGTVSTASYTNGHELDMTFQLPMSQPSNYPVRTTVKKSVRKVSQRCTPPSTARKAANKLSEDRESKIECSQKMAKPKRQRLGKTIESLPVSVVVDERTESGRPLECHRHSADVKPSLSTMNKLAAFMLDSEPRKSCLSDTNDDTTIWRSPARSQSTDDQILHKDNAVFDFEDTSTNMEVSSADELVVDSDLRLSSSWLTPADKIESPNQSQSSRSTPGGSGLLVPKNGEYPPVDEITTMVVLNSDLSVGEVPSHAGAETREEHTSADVFEMSLETADDTEEFDLDEEVEEELAELADWIADEHRTDVQSTATELPPSHRTPQSFSSLTEPAVCVSPISASSFPPQRGPQQSTAQLHKPSAQVLKPFTRPPFPKPLQDHSPITGIKSSTILRTCFRIGEALNAASLASRSGTTILTELYARVRFSSREPDGGKQRLEFGDLFCGERPPFLSGTYELWREGGLWEEDSKVFVGDEGRGKMCRAVGWLKRDLETRMWKMVVLSIWEADWEDVEWVKGIVGA